MAIKIDKNKCIGCGTCEAVCPEVFKMGNNGLAEIKAQKNLPCVKEAIDVCPVRAISR